MTAAAFAANIFLRKDPFSESELPAVVPGEDLTLRELRCVLGRLDTVDLLTEDADRLIVADPLPEAAAESSGAADFLTTFLWVILSPESVPLLLRVGLLLRELRLGFVFSSSWDMTLSRDVARETTLDLVLVDPESLSNTPPAAVFAEVDFVVFSPEVLLPPANVAVLPFADPALLGVVFSAEDVAFFLLAVPAGFFTAVTVFFLGFSGDIVSLLLVL